MQHTKPTINHEISIPFLISILIPICLAIITMAIRIVCECWHRKYCVLLDEMRTILPTFGRSPVGDFAALAWLDAPPAHSPKPFVAARLQRLPMVGSGPPAQSAATLCEGCASRRLRLRLLGSAAADRGLIARPLPEGCRALLGGGALPPACRPGALGHPSSGRSASRSRAAPPTPRREAAGWGCVCTTHPHLRWFSKTKQPRPGLFGPGHPAFL